MVVKNMRTKRGQLTIFIIVAVIIVAVILIFLLVIQPGVEKRETPRLEGFEGCVQDAVEENLNKIGSQGGFINPEFYKLYQGEKIAYLCYTNLYYKPCVVQKPFLKKHVELQLENSIGDEIDSCYQESIEDLKEKGYEIAYGNVDFEINLQPENIFIGITAPTSTSGRSFEKFSVAIPSNYYEIVMVATSILQQEIKYGDSNVNSLMIFYPELKIEKLKQSDGSTIYIITDKNSEIKFQFASRSLAKPAGYGFGSRLVGR